MIITTITKVFHVPSFNDFLCSIQALKQQQEAASTTPADPNTNGLDALASHLKMIVVMLILMMLMLFAVHCTWVTSNAYSSPSIVLSTTNYDG